MGCSLLLCVLDEALLWRVLSQKPGDAKSGSDALSGERKRDGREV